MHIQLYVSTQFFFSFVDFSFFLYTRMRNWGLYFIDQRMEEKKQDACFKSEGVVS